MKGLTTVCGEVMKTLTLVWVVCAVTPVALLPQSTQFHPGIDRKLWDDVELRAITLPPAVPAGKILYLPSDAYYQLKPLSIYKTYPVYVPDHEPKGYFKWLRRQEPAIVFDP